MSHRLSCRRSLVVVANALLIGAVALPAAGDEPPKAATAAPTPAPSVATPQARFGMSQASLMPGGEQPAKPIEPSDGKWLKDENGREYFVHQIPKSDPFVIGVEGKLLKMRWNMEAELVGQNSESYLIKWYRQTADATGPSRRRIDPAEQAKLLASLRPEVQEVDRLEFQNVGAGLPEEGQWREGFRLFDFNQDGNLDIVHGPARKVAGPPVVFAGDGKGTWKRLPSVFPRLSYDYGDVAVADFNGDGLPDVALAMHIKGLMVLASDKKSGAYESWSGGLPYEVPGRGGAAAGFASRAIAAVDWNRDGRPDLVTLGEGPRMAASSDGPRVGQSESYGVVVSLNQGDGTWKRIDRGMVSGNIFGNALAVGDLNGDGLADIVTASGVQGREDLINLGQPDGSWVTQTLDPLPDESYVRAVALGDLDADGRIDIVAGYLTFFGKKWTSGIDTYLNRGDRWERHQLIGEASREGFSSVAVGDIDGDGRADVVALRGEGATLVLLGDGKGGAVREVSPEITIWKGCGGSRAEFGDLDGDGRQELVTAFAGEASGFADPTKCLNGGGIQAWKSRAKAPEAAGRH